MLTAAKAVSLSSQRLLLDGKSAIDDPDETTRNLTLDANVSNLDGQIRELLDNSRVSIASSVRKHQEFNRIRADMLNFQLDFTNPFHELTPSPANDIDR